MWNISKNMTYTPYFFRRNRDLGTISEARSGRGLIRMCVCAIMWAAWRTSVPVSTPSKARAVGRRACQRAPAHADEVRRWPQKPAGGARCHGHGRDELAGCRPSRWAYWTDGCVGPAAQRSGRPAGAVGGGRHPDEENGRAGRGDIHTNAIENIPAFIKNTRDHDPRRTDRTGTHPLV